MIEHQLHLPPFLDSYFKDFDSMGFYIEPFQTYPDIAFEIDQKNTNNFKLLVKVDNVWHDLNNLSTQYLLDHKFMKKVAKILKRHCDSNNRNKEICEFIEREKTFKI